jgi:hypothetical protein
MEILAEKKHQTHQEESDEEANLHGQFFFLALLTGLYWIVWQIAHLRWRPLTNRIEPALMERMTAQHAPEA